MIFSRMKIGSPDSAAADPVRRANRWLRLILVAAVACSLSAIAVYHLQHVPWMRSFYRTGWSVVPSLFGAQYKDDSLGPMGRAFQRWQSRDDGDIYGIFFEEGRKFQYPPTSLLVFHVLPAGWLGPENFVKEETYTKLAGPPLVFMRTASQLAVLLTIAASIAIMETGIRRLRPAGSGSAASRVARIGIGAFLGLTFYPVVKAHELGQIQVFLNALTALGVLAHMVGWRARSGFCLGLCCLIKPQYAVILIWALLRRHWRMLAGFMAAVVPLGLTSLAVFGWENHLRYIEVIRKIARLGEAYWPNQCFNGFANRLIGNGDAVGFSAYEFAPYHPWVHAGTMVTSLLILGVVLYRRRPVDGNLDLAAVIASATLASPIAWEHHYGSFLPLFALALPACLGAGASARKLGVLLGISFLAMGFALRVPDSFFNPAWLGWTASHLFFGALLFLGLVLYLRRRPAAAAAMPGTLEPQIQG